MRTAHLILEARIAREPAAFHPRLRRGLQQVWRGPCRDCAMRRLVVPLAIAAWISAAVDSTAGIPLAAKDAGGLPAPRVGPLDYRLTPLEERLFAQADAGHSLTGGRLDDIPLLDAALVAGGVDDPAELAHYRRQWDQWVDALKHLGTVRGKHRQQAQAVFEFLHGRLLTGGYSLACTDLRQAFDHGRFNCVSASVLFQALAGELGLEVCSLETPGHVMSRLRTADGPLDIETTCPRWFQRPEPPAKDAWRRREVSEIELLAMIYYNRGVDLLAEKRFVEAAVANAKALRLAPGNATARGNLLVTLNNWAIELGAAARYAEAAELLRLGLAIEPDYAAFRLNYAHLRGQWVRQLEAASPGGQAAGQVGLTVPGP
jgi:tetratricopeptide (TPR) repeat protein